MPLGDAQVLGLVVRDAPQAALLTMRVYLLCRKQDLILRSLPKAGVSKDGHEGTATICDSPALAGERVHPLCDFYSPDLMAPYRLISSTARTSGRSESWIGPENGVLISRIR
ncbi:hypothetical protein AB7M47_004842 [Bradyrhizobium elkanii]|jgi:hypothetical protein